MHLAAGQALFNVPRQQAARLPLALATPTAACGAGGGGGGGAGGGASGGGASGGGGTGGGASDGGGTGGGAVAIASALELLGPAGRETMRDLAGAAEQPSGPLL